MMISMVLLAAQFASQEWTIYGGDLGSTRYSTLRQIHAGNVARLGVAWVFQTGVSGRHEGTPLVEDGILYVTAPSGHAYALDARTGRQLWHHSRPLPEKMVLCCGTLNRGVALAGDRVLLTTVDAHLLALDKKTGRTLWDTVMADYKPGYSATAAPLVIRDKVIAGMAGGDTPTRGFIDAYSIATGERLWRFWTIPSPGEPGSETWSGDSWRRGGAATWVTGSYDPDLNLVFWGVGNPAPDINGEVRLGDNLYSNCMVALDADTGKLRWYYQFTPHDTHDWDGVNEPVLADLTIDGQPRKALLHADRNGFLYALDRTSGKVIWGKPFVKTTWAEKLDANGRPLVKPNTEPTPEGNDACPGLGGGKNWNHMAFNPQTGLVYVPSAESCEKFYIGDGTPHPGQLYMGSINESIPSIKPWGALRAFDARDGKLVWEFRTIRSLRGSVLTTAGDLVLVGDGHGYLIAFHARSGKVLWKLQLGAGVSAPPMTYMLDGRQYLSVLAGTALFTLGLPEAAEPRP